MGSDYLQEGIDALNELEKPEERDLAAELTGNYNAANEVAGQWVSGAESMGYDLGAAYRGVSEAANPEMYALLNQQGQGVDLDRVNLSTVDPSLFLPGGAAAVSGTGANLVSAPGQVSFRDVTVGNVGVSDVSAQDVSAPERSSVRDVSTGGAAAYTDVQGQQLNQVGQSDLLQQLNTSAQGQGYSSIAQALEQLSLDELALGDELSAEDEYRASQDARVSSEALGRLGDNSSIANEVLSRSDARNDRLNERVTRAMDTGNYMLGEKDNWQNFQLGVEGANRSLDEVNTTRDIANQSTDLQAQMTNQNAQITTQVDAMERQLRADLANQGVDQAIVEQQVAVMRDNADRQLTAGMSNQNASLQAQMANQSAQLTAGMANQSGDIQTGMLNAEQVYDASKYNASALTSAASSATAASQANWDNYLRALGFNNDVALGQTSFNNDATLSEYGAGQTALGNWQSVAIDPMSASLELLNPYSSYAENLAAQNYEGEWSGYNADANNTAAMYGAQMTLEGAEAQADAAENAGGVSAGGSIVGSIIDGIFCWVARAAYGVRDRRWREFRAWLFTQASSEFFRWYGKQGRDAGALLERASDECRAGVREWMNGRRVRDWVEVLRIEEQFGLEVL